MKPIFAALATLALPLAATAQTGIVQSPAYKECIALSGTDPVKALAKADEWLAIDNGIAARHCHAMALYGQRRYAEAGEELNSLRFVIPEDNLTLRSFVARQAVSSWTNGNRADAALAVLEQQINDMKKIKGNNATAAKIASELLLDRARLNITYGKLNVAMQDLDHAVSLTPLNVDVLNERANTFEMLGDHALAKADAEAVLTLSPNNAKARGLLAKIDKAK